MGVRVECDWCRQTIPAGDPYVTVEIDGKVGCGAEAPRDVSAPARVYCGRDRYTDDDPAAGGVVLSSRRGWTHRVSCAQRVLAALEGNPVGRVDMGLEWRLVPQAAPRAGWLIDGPVDELGLSDRALRALRQAGVDQVHALAELTEAQWFGIRGIGRNGADEIREALHRRHRTNPTKLGEEVPS